MLVIPPTHIFLARQKSEVEARERVNGSKIAQ